MHEHDEHGRGKGVVWGLFLILIGAGFLAERFGLIEVPAVARLWPIVLFVIGITHLVDRRPGSAVNFVLMGVVFLAAANEWWGFHYANSWPLLLVAAGIGLVIKAYTHEDSKRRKSSKVEVVVEGHVPGFGAVRPGGDRRDK